MIARGGARRSLGRAALLAAIAGGLAFLFVLVAAHEPSTASAQTSGTAKQVPISLSNRTGTNYHLWIGHTPASSQKAYVIPGGIALWYVDFKAGGRNANNVIYIDDKLTVNAMRLGETSSSSVVTSTFNIRGFAKNIRVVWDGSAWHLLVDYEDDAGGRLSGGDGQASPSGPGQIEDAGDIGDLDPAELTKALNAAIIAIIAGILAGGLGAAGAETAPAGPAGEAAPESAAPPDTGPLDSGLRDPGGNAVTAWEPGKYEGGQLGDVWYGNRWIPAAQAAADIASDAADLQATRDREAAQEAYNRQWDQAYRERNAQLDAEAQARQRQADAEAKQQREWERAALHMASQVRDIALRRGDHDMYQRASQSLYGPDGKLDFERARRMRETMGNRITRDLTDDPSLKGPQSDGTWEGLKEAAKPFIRLGLGYATGGTSEAIYTGLAAQDALNEAMQKAIAEGRDFGYGESFRTAFGSAAKQRLPINTVGLLMTKKWKDITVTEMASSAFSDAMSGYSNYQGFKNLKASADAFKSGQGLMKTLTARAPTPPPDTSSPGLNGLPEGSKVPPGSGMSSAAARHQQWVSETRGVKIQTRPVSKEVLRRQAEGDVMKPPTIKAKTINDVDELLGAPTGQQGRVGFFKPKMPDTTGMSPEKIIEVQKRFLQRRNEYRDLGKDMLELRRKGEIRFENGVVKTGSGKYITGDYDVYSITMKDGSPAPEWLKQQVMRDLKKPPFNAQHDAHLDWKYDPNDPLHGKANTTIDQTIRETHAPPRAVDPNSSIIEQGMANRGGVPLITTNAGGGTTPRTSFDHGEVLAS